MTASEVFYKFYRETLEPNERVAFMLIIKKESKEINKLLLLYSDEPQYLQLGYINKTLEKEFVERFIRGTWSRHNTLGRYGYGSSCCRLSSFMKYFIHYFPSVIGTARVKNKYMARIPITDDRGIGYKEYHRRRLIKKWHDFLKENVVNYNQHIAYYVDTKNYKLKKKA
jgi:hypothetical protein